MLSPSDAYDAVRELVCRTEWVALDTETTGLGEADQVIEVAILSATGVVLLESLVRPAISVPAEVAAKTGLSMACLGGAPSWREVLPAVRRLLEGREVVAFHAAFDERLIRQTCTSNGLLSPAPRCWTCAQALLSPLWQREHVSLERVCRTLGIEPGTHRAAADTHATIRALRAVASRPMQLFPAE